MGRSLVFLLAAVISYTSPTFAQDIEVPEEELARETTLPVFQRRRAVLNRRVVTENRLEFGLGAGLELNEPYYSDMMFGAQGTYNYSDTSAVNVQFLMWTDGLSQYGEQLKSGTSGGTQFEKFDAMKAPHPLWAVFANYQFIAYYGKISISKQTVANLNLFGLIGLGYINMGEVNTFGLNLGLGQNFFITKSIAIRADLRWLIFQGPNATSQSLEPSDNPSADSFDDRIFYNGQLGLALVFVL